MARKHKNHIDCVQKDRVKIQKRRSLANKQTIISCVLNASRTSCRQSGFIRRLSYESKKPHKTAARGLPRNRYKTTDNPISLIPGRITTLLRKHMLEQSQIQDTLFDIPIFSINTYVQAFSMCLLKTIVPRLMITLDATDSVAGFNHSNDHMSLSHVLRNYANE
ncbi:hypothetical protein BD560DRAFT_427998 [Blakeslea trispora]|nr:hypothetical protein BD560DRAFT_427998 [Blakeslea trispora]